MSSPRGNRVSAGHVHPDEVLEVCEVDRDVVSVTSGLVRLFLS